MRGRRTEEIRRKAGIRIIGGKWRGRKLAVGGEEGLRPTPDRVRETLFNWLQPVIDGARCLDLYAGSGVLGFEALSRGAGRVTMVERNRNTAALLMEQGRRLQAEGLEVICTDAADFLEAPGARFDIVFVDPPFSEDLHEKACESLLNRGHLQPDALVYLESEREITGLSSYTLYRRSRAGRVHFILLRGENGNGRE